MVDYSRGIQWVGNVGRWGDGEMGGWGDKERCVCGKTYLFALMVNIKKLLIWFSLFLILHNSFTNK
ncbi:MAG: hypothetical protein F6K54_26040 [Okeania sp. SIO3B5]|uniref:hypothetical protein n=1 Tax=Okeania sp. SIO3B5 TaxID=2607811 RepID=UPI001401723A|nr:hypothetical protein [Okeania sp. SIO3B5]NEO56237.1 hypothetical protein [Okeania sp. SIO3B5]